jgi:MraZ protein
MLFLSTFTNRVDKKGRVSVPSAFRTAIAGTSFQGVVLFRSYKYPALEGCGMDQMESMCAQMDHLPLFSDDRDALTDSIFADAVPLAFDPEGRITLTDELRDHANLSESVAFVGKGRMFQLWSPEAFTIHQAGARARAKTQNLSLRRGD